MGAPAGPERPGPNRAVAYERCGRGRLSGVPTESPVHAMRYGNPVH